MARNVGKSSTRPVTTVVLTGLVVVLAVGLVRQLWVPMMLRTNPGALVIGNSIPAVRIASLSEPPSSPLRLKDLVDGSRCTVLAFYHSDCPICHEVAARWRDLDLVRLRDANAGVLWLSVIDTDSGAVSFHTGHDLPGEPMAIRGRLGSHRLGILTWPRFVVVDSAGRYRGEGSRDPMDYSTYSTCGSPAIL